MSSGGDDENPEVAKVLGSKTSGPSDARQSSVRRNVAETSPSPPNMEATAELLHRVRQGDDGARDRLIRRYIPLLQKWGRGRLPAGARNLAETDDLVQITLIRALNRLEAFEPRREGAFLSYLRKILLNAIREEARKGARRISEPVSESLPDPRSLGPRPEGGTLERYESALETLSERQREAAILRLEFGYSYGQISEAVACPSAEAARKIVERAIVRLATAMDRSDPSVSG